MPKRKRKLKPWDVTQRPVYWFRPQKTDRACTRCGEDVKRYELAAEGRLDVLCITCFEGPGTSTGYLNLQERVMRATGGHRGVTAEPPSKPRNQRAVREIETPANVVLQPHDKGGIES